MISKPKQKAFQELFAILDLEWREEYVSEGGTVTGKGLNVLLGEVSFRNGLPQLGLPELEVNRLTLMIKSLEACTLSLEMIKRSYPPYRTESFLTLFMNAWELILKAKILYDGGKIFKEKEAWKTITFVECYEIVFPDDNNPIRKNLAELVELRNSATHFFIHFTPFSMIPIFQAGIINYKNRLQEWFDYDIRKLIPEGSMILLVDKEYQKEISVKLKRKLSKDTISFINDWEKRIKKKIEKISEKDLKLFFNIIEFPLEEDNKVTRSAAMSYFGAFELSVGEQLSVYLK